MAKNETLRIKIETDGDGKTKASLAGVEKGLVGVDGAAKRTSASTAGTSAGLSTLARVGAAAAVVTLVTLAKQALTAAGAMDDLSQRFGIAVPKMSQLANIARVNGVEIGTLSSGLTTLAENIQNAATDKSSEAAQYFKALGISVTDTNGALRSTDDVLTDVAARFSDAADGTEKTTAASALFGKRVGGELIPMLNNLDTEMGRVNSSVSTEFAAAADTFGENMGRMAVTTQSFMSKALTPVLQGLNALFTAAAGDNNFAAALTGNIETTSGSFIGALTGMDVAVKALDADLKAVGETAKKPLAIPNKDLAKQTKEASDATAQYRAELQRTAEAIKQQTDPAYRMNKELALYDKLLDKNMLTTSQWASATSASWEEFNQAIGNTGNATDTLSESAQQAKSLFEETRTPMEKLNAEYTRLDNLLQDGAIDFDTYSRAVFAAEEKTSDFGKTVESTSAEAAKALQANLSDTFYGAMTGRFDDVNDAFRDMLRKMVANALASGISKAIFGDTSGGKTGGEQTGFWTGLISSLISGSVSGTTTPPEEVNYVPKAKASGGDITGGRPYLVGERGPELIVPGASGTVIPNHRIGGGDTTINQSFDFRGAQPGESLRLRAEAARIKADTIATIFSQIERGGSAARTVGRR